MLFSLSGVARYMAIVEGNVTIAAARRGVIADRGRNPITIDPGRNLAIRSPGKGTNLARIAQRPGSRALGSRRQLDWSIHIN